MKNKIFFNNFFYFTFFWFINTMNLNDIKNINIDDIKIGDNNLYEQNNATCNYSVTIKNNNMNFIYVNLKGKNETTYILSFYKNDSNFIQRNQFFQSYNNEINMWLTKSQSNEQFFFDVECYIDIFPCSYYINIIGRDNIEMKLNKIYSYYITKETENMIFLFNDNLPNGKNMVSIWANGNKNIITSIENYTVRNGNFYQFYLKGDHNSNFNHSFQVNGTLGDIINIGALTFNESGYSSFVLNDNIEIYGYLNNETMEKNCFFYNHLNLGNITLLNKDYENMNITFDNHNNFFCINLTNSTENKKLYSFYYYTNNPITYEMNSPYIYGFEHSTRYVKEKDSVKFVLVKPENYFDYYIYRINDRNGSFEQLKVQLCYNYPLCNSSNMEELVIYYNSLQYIFLKKDLYEFFNDFSYSPINKKQIIITATCESAEKYIDNNSTYDFIPGYCLLDLNTYIETYNSEFNKIENHKNENKNNNKTYNISYNYTVNFVNIYIEVMYGDISIHFKNDSNEQRLYKNKYIFEFSQDNIDELTIIGTKEENYYHISYFPLVSDETEDYIYLFNIGGNYLFLNNELHSIITFENKLDQLNNSFNDTIFIAFYPILGEFTPYSMENDKMDIMKMDGLAFYQDIRKLDKKYKNFSYYVNNIEYEESLFSISVFNLNSEDGIILYKENPQLFKFSKENKVMKFTYFHKENEINTFGNQFCGIEIKSENNSKMNLTVNYKHSYSNNYTIEKEIEVPLKFTKESFEKGVCKITFNLSLNDDSKSNLVKITIFTGNNKLFLIMIYINIGIIAIVIIIVLLLIRNYLQSNSLKIKESNQYQIIEEEQEE